MISGWRYGFNLLEIIQSALEGWELNVMPHRGAQRNAASARESVCDLKNFCHLAVCSKLVHYIAAGRSQAAHAQTALWHYPLHTICNIIMLKSSTTRGVVDIIAMTYMISDDAACMLQLVWGGFAVS